MSPIDRLTCEETFRRLDDYLDRELDAEERRLVDQHLADCEVCAREYRFEQSVIDQVRSKLHRLVAPPDMVDRILARLAS